MELHDLTDYYEGDASKIRTISVTSGKGGVGKTNFVVNIAIQLAKLGKKVLILDADFGLANIDILMNLQPKYTVEELFKSGLSIENIITEGPLGIDVIPASSGIQEMTDLSMIQQKFLINELSRIQLNYEYLIIDTGAGMGKNTMRFNASVEEVIVITNSEPTALTDAYAIMKVLSWKYEVNTFYLIVNNSNQEMGMRVSELIKNVSQRNKNNFKVIYLGNLPQDPNFSKAVQSRTPYVIAFPESKTTEAYAKISRQLNFLPGELPEDQNMSSFLKKFFSWTEKKFY